MIIPKVHGLALIALLIVFLPLSARADEGGLLSRGWNGLKAILFDSPEQEYPQFQTRPKDTNLTTIEKHGHVRHGRTTSQEIEGCVTINPYSGESLPAKAGRAVRAMANHAAAPIEKLSVRPYFSGLKGPKLTIIRRDLERTLIEKRGSSNEIYHNASLSHADDRHCLDGLTSSWDMELRHQIDAWDSDRAPLVRGDVIVNNRIQFAGYFVGTISGRYMLYDNLDTEPDLRILNRLDPIRQDLIGYTQEPLGLSRMMLSGFVTPFDDFYVSAHAGYLEEMFFGYGAEFLYRPYNRSVAVGGEVWKTVKRQPYAGGPLETDDDNEQTSALLNLWYDTPIEPLTAGLSAGRFLDGDSGYQLLTLYKPEAGWKIQGYATFSDDKDATINKDEETNWIIGARLTMPLGSVRGVPENSRQTFEVAPLARDHGQRIDKAYPLYDITEKWQERHIKANWGDIVN